MIDTVPDILARIVAKKREDLAKSTFVRPALERQGAVVQLQRRDFKGALRARSPALIAEIKKASPSKGILSTDFDPVRLAAQYEAGGAAALSVLTDESFFQGSLSDLRDARQAVSLPVLRKDFTIAEIQVVEAAANGADAVLLIAAILKEREIRDLRELATSFGIHALVEVHSEPELLKAINGGSEIVGVNNRDLTTFEVTLETSLRLAERIPSGTIKVSESGIQSARDIRLLRDAGYDAFLVGEHLMRSPDPTEALRALSAAS